MKYLSLKSVIYILTISLLQIGIFSVDEVFAYHNDTEILNENIFSAGSLDFILEGYRFNEDDIQGETNANIEIINEGTLDFKYIVFTEFETRTPFCNNLTLKAYLNGDEIYNGNLVNFSSIETSTLGTWEFRLIANKNSFGTCDFNFKYQGWQKEIANYSDRGFYDEETVGNIVSKAEPKPEPRPRPKPSPYPGPEPNICIKINEVYYYPGIKQNNAEQTEENPQDQWVELYNACNVEINIKDWYLENEDNSEVINQNKTIAPHQFVVIAPNSSTWTFWPNIPSDALKIALGGTKLFNDGLDVTGDIIVLYDSEGNQIDKVSWGDNIDAFSPSIPNVIIGHSISRKEKGVDSDTAEDWLDTNDWSTPPGPNPGTNPHTADGKLLTPFLNLILPQIDDLITTSEIPEIILEEEVPAPEIPLTEEYPEQDEGLELTDEGDENEDSINQTPICLPEENLSATDIETKSPAKKTEDEEECPEEDGENNNQNNE